VEGEGAARRTLARSATKDKDGIDVYHWKRTAPDGKDVETNTVQDALFDLGGVEVQSFVDQPAGLDTYGLDKPALKVTLRFEGKPVQWVAVGRKGSDVYGQRSGDQAVLKLDPAKVDELLKAWAKL